ncbi:hypothetical protein LCGC14_1888780, partial [marine sediment metagenome]
MKKVSIIIPNTDSLLIREVITSLKQQTADMSAVEIIVVGSDEPGLVIEDEMVRFVPTGQSSSYASNKRNIGIQTAEGAILLFLDDDCLPAADWLEHHLYRHGQGEQVVGGAVTFGTENYLQLADNVSAFHDLLPFTPESVRPYLSTANLSVNRKVVEKVGLMGTHMKRAEDLEWTVRFRAGGFRLYFEPRAAIFHKPARNTISKVWQHWVDDAPDTLRVRLMYQKLLKTPFVANYRGMYLWGAPLVAAWATARTFSHAQTFYSYWHTLPAVYLTKMIWCWGAFLNFPKISSQPLTRINRNKKN